MDPGDRVKAHGFVKVFLQAYYIDLLDEALFQRLLTDPGQFANMLRAQAPHHWVVLDEVQRIGSLLNEVHRFIESQHLKFALSGSSARKLKRGAANLLAGRALYYTMFPFVPAELGADFDIKTALRYGTLPIVWMAHDKQATLTAYVQTYLKEEIRAEALVRNLPGFLRFLPIAALFHGQRLNISSVARDSGVARSTIQSYLEILKDTLMCDFLEAYRPRLRVREKNHPKLYWIDPGLVRALKQHGGPVQSEEQGALLEGFVFMLLRSQQQLSTLYDALYYWSPADAYKTEVDFLLKQGKTFIAIEVKSTAKIRKGDLRGLQAISQLEGLNKKIIVYLGDQVQKTEDDIMIYPLHEFCHLLANGKL